MIDSMGSRSEGIQGSRENAKGAKEYMDSRGDAEARRVGIQGSRGDTEARRAGIQDSREDAEIAERKLEIDEITGVIVDESMKIHKGLGPGLLESVYEMVLAKRLKERGLHVQCQRTVSFEYEGLFFDEGFRCDMLVEQKVILELKSVESIHPVHKKATPDLFKIDELKCGSFNQLRCTSS